MSVYADRVWVIIFSYLKLNSNSENSYKRTGYRMFEAQGLFLCQPFISGNCVLFHCLSCFINYALLIHHLHLTAVWSMVRWYISLYVCNNNKIESKPVYSFDFEISPPAAPMSLFAHEPVLHLLLCLITFCLHQALSAFNLQYILKTVITVMTSYLT